MICVHVFFFFSGVEARYWGVESGVVGNPAPPIHQPGDYFQRPLQNVKASLSKG